MKTIISILTVLFLATPAIAEPPRVQASPQERASPLRRTHPLPARSHDDRAVPRRLHRDAPLRPPARLPVVNLPQLSLLPSGEKARMRGNWMFLSHPKGFPDPASSTSLLTARPNKAIKISL